MLRFARRIPCIEEEYNLNLELIYEQDALVGLMIHSFPEAESEYFCKTFGGGLFEGSGSIEIVGDGLILTNPAAPRGSGVAFFEIEDADILTKLRDLLLDREKSPKLAFRNTYDTMTHGFKITLAEYADVSTPIPLLV